MDITSRNGKAITQGRLRPSSPMGHEEIDVIGSDNILNSSKACMVLLRGMDYSNVSRFTREFDLDLTICIRP